MKIKTQDLIGPALDWAVAKCEGTPLCHAGRLWPTNGASTIAYAPGAVHPVVNGSGPYVASLCHHSTTYSTDWSQGGQIIERERISTKAEQVSPRVIEWAAEIWPNYALPCTARGAGPTALIAAMRCYVASKLGYEVDVPDELLKGGA